jgi:hypothetical protein
MDDLEVRVFGVLPDDTVFYPRHGGTTPLLGASGLTSGSGASEALENEEIIRSCR